VEYGIGGGFGLGAGQAFDIGAGQFVPAWRLVDIGGRNLVRDDADLRQKREAAGAGGGQFQAGPGAYLKRNVMRPLLRS